MTQRETRILRRRWLAEQMGALTAAMDALPKVADPGPSREGMEPAAYMAILRAYHDASEAYCAAWDGFKYSTSNTSRNWLKTSAASRIPTPMNCGSLPRTTSGSSTWPSS